MAISNKKTTKVAAKTTKAPKETPAAKAAREKAERLAAKKAARAQAEAEAAAAAKKAKAAAAKAKAKAPAKAKAKTVSAKASKVVGTSVFLSITTSVQAEGKPTEAAYTGVGGVIIPRTDVVAVVGTTIYYKTLQYLGTIKSVDSKNGVVIYITENGPVIALQPSLILTAPAQGSTVEASADESDDDADEGESDEDDEDDGSESDDDEDDGDTDGDDADDGDDDSDDDTDGDDEDDADDSDDDGDGDDADDSDDDGDDDDTDGDEDDEDGDDDDAADSDDDGDEELF